MIFDGIPLEQQKSLEDLNFVKSLIPEPEIKAGVKKHLQPQIVYCGNKWSPLVESFYKTFKIPPVLHIASPPQAIKYGKVKPILYHVPDNFDDKMKKLIGMYRIFLFCSVFMIESLFFIFNAFYSSQFVFRNYQKYGMQ